MVNEEPSKQLLLLVDIVLEKYPYQPIHSLAWMPHIMSGQQGKLDTETFTSLIEFLRTNSSTIRDFLLKEGYLKCVDWRNPTDELTDKGKLAKEKGGHTKYKEWEEKEEKKSALQEFPKKKWYLYEPIKWAVFFMLGLCVNKYICNPIKENNDQKPSQVKAQPSISPIQPKISDTTGKAK